MDHHSNAAAAAAAITIVVIVDFKIFSCVGRSVGWSVVRASYSIARWTSPPAISRELMSKYSLKINFQLKIMPNAVVHCVRLLLLLAAFVQSSRSPCISTAAVERAVEGQSVGARQADNGSSRREEKKNRISSFAEKYLQAAAAWRPQIYSTHICVQFYLLGRSIERAHSRSRSADHKLQYQSIECKKTKEREKEKKIGNDGTTCRW